MKLFKTLLFSAISVCGIFGFSSCNDDSTPGVPLYGVDLENAQISFNSDNYWTGCYDVAIGDFKADGLTFSHKAWADEWDGVSYPSWKGFCPSKVNDTSDHADDWIAHQWACVPQNPQGMIYLVGNSEATVSENPLENDKCALTVDEGYINPLYVYVTNSTYAYYAAKNGTAFNSAFTVNDKFELNIVGVRNGQITKQIIQPIMIQGNFLDYWLPISLEPLGTVDKVLFYVNSTQKNSYGLTVPAYFCLASFVYTLPAETANAN